MHSARSTLGDDWISTFSDCRINPDTFFDRKKLTHEAFCLDILKDMYLDHIDIQCKVQLLLLLQEQSSNLIQDYSLLEKICGSLTTLFGVIKNNSGHRFIRSQILICISTLLLSSDLENECKELTFNLKKLLLTVIYNEKEDFVVISTACKCLEEIEVFYPNELESELKSIFLSSEKHLSPAFQSYTSLLSLCIKNYSFQEAGLKIPEDRSMKSDYVKDEIQISAIISHVMELIPLMSPMSVYRVMKNLISVLKQSPDISPVVFKFFLPNLIFSSEVLYVDLAFDLLENFHSDLFSPQEEKCLLKQLLLLSSHPCLTFSHRMLFLDWLKNRTLNNILTSSLYPMLKSLLPGPFDGPLTQEKKCSVLALFISKTLDKNLGLVFLNESVSGLKKCALLPCRTKAAASFFRTLYTFFSYHEAKWMFDYVYKLLLGIMKTYPHLLQYALNFLDAVKTEFPNSTFSKEVQAHMMNHILSLRMKQFASNLECYLAILEQASEICGSEYKPRSVLRLLQNLFCESTSHEINVWEFGNNILSVCRSILLFHSTQLFYYDLAELLCLIAQNVDDAEVEYRAKIYYNELITLSKLKMQSIFNMKVPERGRQNCMTPFVPGVPANLQFASRIQVLSKPVVELVRIKKSRSFHSEETACLNSLSDSDILDIYKTHFDTCDAVVELPFFLRHISDSEKIFDKLYGIVILGQSSPPCKKISVIKIPVYKRSSTAEEDSVFHIEIVPCESQPLELHFEIEFTCCNGQSYVCFPDPVFLNFKDFFLTLPIPPVLKQYDSSWKKNLFEILWEEFQKDIPDGSNKRSSCKSAICLKTSKEELKAVIEEQWKEFIVAKFDEFKHWLAIFLPPKNHLLMKVDIINEKPFINFVVDDISILPWIALYLQKIS